jgi:hypothetical protein
MKILSFFLISCVLLFSNCKEATVMPAPEAATNVIKTMPFENSQFKIERASINLPKGVKKIHFFDESNGICLTSRLTFGHDSTGIETAANLAIPSSNTEALYTTQDRGATWTLSYELAKPINYQRTSGFEVIDNQTIIAFVDGLRSATAEAHPIKSVIIRSTDRGKTWTKKIFPATYLRALTVGMDNTIYALGDCSGEASPTNRTPTFMYSDDKALTWNILSVPSSFDPRLLVCVSPNQLMMFWGHEQVFTSNRGKIWEIKAATPRISSISFADKTGYYLTNYYGLRVNSISQSTNKGENWSDVPVKLKFPLQVKALSPNAAMVLGSGLYAGFSLTLDAGKTWTETYISDNIDAWQLTTSSFYDAQNGYLVASSGFGTEVNILYKFTIKQ